jgi:ubiquinone/menaquinone biosynthesis C-methylase UbiE
MLDTHVNNPKSIKYYVKKFIEGRGSQLQKKVVLDVPAGNGVTTEILLKNGASVEPFDLFPEYFKVKDVECKRANIYEGLPVKNNHADMLICQEGIEHFSDHLKAFKEFNRTLKVGGELVMTTPSYSNLSSRFSYFLFESETNKQMPPNELTDIWMADQSITNEIYHGHIFLIGLQKLRTLGKLAGFNIKEIKFVRLSRESLILLPIFYPFIFLSSVLRYFRNMKKNPEIPKSIKAEVYKEQLQININPKHLLNKHTFIIFEKEKECQDVNFNFDSVMKSFSGVM